MPDLTTYTWRELAPVTHPNAEINFGMVGTASGVFLYGGTGSTYYDETWLLVGEEWTQLSPAADPGPLYGYSMAYNPDDDYVLLFGGYDGIGGTRRDDTWKYDFGTGNWSNLSPSTTPLIDSDYAALSTVMQYIGGGEFLMFWQTLGPAVSRLASFDGSDWTILSPASDPAAGQGGNLLSQPSSIVLNGNFTLFGGGTNSQPAIDAGALYATHEYTASDWSVVAAACHPNPFPSSVVLSHPDNTREGLAFGMASAGAEAVLFGGRLYDIGVIGTFSVADTWMLDSSGWTELPQSVHPAKRYIYGMAYDFVDERFVLYGGYTETGAVTHGYTDTWVFEGPPAPPVISVASIRASFGLGS